MPAVRVLPGLITTSPPSASASAATIAIVAVSRANRRSGYGLHSAHGVGPSAPIRFLQGAANPGFVAR